MSLSELIEQLQMIKDDHPDAAHLDVRINDLDAHVVWLRDDEGERFVEIQCARPWALNT
jgi:hypothetical protein